MALRKNRKIVIDTVEVGNADEFISRSNAEEYVSHGGHGFTWAKKVLGDSGILFEDDVYWNCEDGMKLTLYGKPTFNDRTGFIEDHLAMLFGDWTERQLDDIVYWSKRNLVIQREEQRKSVELAEYGSYWMWKLDNDRY